ncbi:MAG: ABC transporter ATP-binding protein [Bacillati bacterium ANGP1]|uniref:ABC transporter ATP-binding protein n=1 Tax=Candidatus Segetimicrobium genomatis TaxID=2569760 RepID=A0A537IWK7_9BACT|nr:MAG: ABC transporter ATP-binding protein [Terrabacteria group bacterium ANGP1]
MGCSSSSSCCLRRTASAQLYGGRAVPEVLRTERLTRVFGGLVAVNEVEFAAEEGEIVGLIGPNGAGKTTFFNLVSGALRVSGGRIFFQGREITHAPAYRRAELGIGRTFQVMKPFPRLTVMENVLVGAFLRHPSRLAAERWAAEILKMMGLSEFAAASARSLTTAGRKRLEIARALALNPTLLLLDEVVAGLNPVEAEGTVELIRRIRDRGTTIIMVEHIMRVIMGLSDRIVVLTHGRKIAEGTPPQVASNPDVINAYLGTH